MEDSCDQPGNTSQMTRWVLTQKGYVGMDKGLAGNKRREVIWDEERGRTSNQNASPWCLVVDTLTVLTF